MNSYIAESILSLVVSIPPKNSFSPFRPCLPEKSKFPNATNKNLKIFLPTLSKELPSVSTSMWEAKSEAGFIFILNSPQTVNLFFGKHFCFSYMIIKFVFNRGKMGVDIPTKHIIMKQNCFFLI